MLMKSRLMFAATAAFALTAISPSAAEAQCFGSPLVDNSSLPVTGCGNDVSIPDDFTVTYVGSSAAFWHSLWVFSADQLTGSLPASPADPFTPGTDGTLIVCKFADCSVNGSPAGAQPPELVTWGGGTAIFGLYVIPTASGTYPGSGYVDGGYWLFSGLTNRNPDNQAHAAYFSTEVLNDDRTTVLATVGTNDFLLGFEDKCRGDVFNNEQDLICSGGSDWDFNDAVFAFAVPDDTTEVVPEPATMTLLATGLVGMAAARRRRNNKK